MHLFDVFVIPAVVLSDIRKGTTVKSLCANISTQMLRDFNYALVWGCSAGKIEIQPYIPPIDNSI